MDNKLKGLSTQEVEILIQKFGYNVYKAQGKFTALKV